MIIGNVKVYALVGRNGDTGHRFTSRQWSSLKISGLSAERAGDVVSVWTVGSDSKLQAYDAAATRRLSDYICKTRMAAAQQ